MFPIMSQFGPVHLFVFWKVSTCALIWAWALIYFLKSVNPMHLFGGGLLFSTQEYSLFGWWYLLVKSCYHILWIHLISFRLILNQIKYDIKYYVLICHQPFGPWSSQILWGTFINHVDNWGGGELAKWPFCNISLVK